MARVTFHRVWAGDPLLPEHLNQYADAIEQIASDRKNEQPTSALGFLALGLTACGAATKRISRRSLLGLDWKR